MSSEATIVATIAAIASVPSKATIEAGFSISLGISRPLADVVQSSKATIVATIDAIASIEAGFSISFGISRPLADVVQSSEATIVATITSMASIATVEAGFGLCQGAPNKSKYNKKLHVWL